MTIVYGNFALQQKSPNTPDHRLEVYDIRDCSVDVLSLGYLCVTVVTVHRSVDASAPRSGITSP